MSDDAAFESAVLRPQVSSKGTGRSQFKRDRSKMSKKFGMVHLGFLLETLN